MPCEMLSHRGVGQLLDTVADVQKILNRDLEVWGILPTLFDGRSNHAREVLADVGERYDLPVLEPADPQDGALRRGAGGGPLDPGHRPHVQGRQGLPRGRHVAAGEALTESHTSSGPAGGEWIGVRLRWTMSVATHHEGDSLISTLPWSHRAPEPAFEARTIEHRDLRDDDVLIDITFAGICHSDIHQVREEWGSAHLPHGPRPRDRRRRLGRR